MAEWDGLGTQTTWALATEAPAHGLPFGRHHEETVGRSQARGWDFLGHVPVPLRHWIRDGVESVLRQQTALGTEPLRCCFPLGQGGQTPFERLKWIRSPEDFPSFLVSAEGPEAFHPKLAQSFLSKQAGVFTSGFSAKISPLFEQAGLVDPWGQVGVYAAAPFVFLIDHQRLAGTQAPQSWQDLCDPQYRHQIVFPGWRRRGERRWSQYNAWLFLALEDLLRPLGRSLHDVFANLATLEHSAQMPRLAGSEQSPGGIFVVPWALADLCPRRHCTSVVWPAEGAFVWPLWMTLQSQHQHKMQPVLDYFSGAELAAGLTQNRYPSARFDGAEAVPMPVGAQLRWLGWDRVRHRTTSVDLKSVRRRFADLQLR